MESRWVSSQLSGQGYPSVGPDGGAGCAGMKGDFQVFGYRPANILRRDESCQQNSMADRPKMTEVARAMKDR